MFYGISTLVCYSIKILFISIYLSIYLYIYIYIYIYIYMSMCVCFSNENLNYIFFNEPSSFVYMQLNVFNYCYSTTIILFNINHLFDTVKWFCVLISNSNNSV